MTRAFVATLGAALMVVRCVAVAVLVVLDRLRRP